MKFFQGKCDVFQRSTYRAKNEGCMEVMQENNEVRFPPPFCQSDSPWITTNLTQVWGKIKLEVTFETA